MIASRKMVTDWLTRTVRKQHRQIVSEHSVSNGRLHTYTRSAAGEDQVFNLEPLQRGIQFGFVEAAESMLVENDIVGLRL